MLNFNYKFFEYLTNYAYFCSKILGLGPYIYNRCTKRLERSQILQWYTVFVGCIIVYNTYITNQKLVANMDHNFKLITPNSLVKILQLMEFTNITINYLTVLILNHGIIEAKNKLLACNLKLLLYSKMEYVNISFKYFMIFVFKEILLKWMIFVSNAAVLPIISNHQLTPVDVMFSCLTQFITYLVSSHFIANLMHSIHLYDIINGELCKIVNELKREQQAIRIARILYLCDTLDLLCDFHWKITRCFKAMIKVFAIPMLMQIIFLYVNIIIFAYMELSLVILNFSKRVTADNLRMVRVSGLFNVGFSLIQLFSYSILSWLVVQKSYKAGQLLHSFSNLGIFDERLVRNVESFSLSLEQNKFEISICGLFVVNYELMYAMAASMTSYLIILVQYQLEFSKSA